MTRRTAKEPEETPVVPRTAVTISGHHSTINWILVFTKLTVEIDGRPHVGSWRKHSIPIEPGDHHVDVYFKYIGQPRCGEASVDIHVPAGTTTGLAYRASNVLTLPGRLEVRSP
ncbi:MAG: hypothetical protein ACYCV7_06445 [Acidimicrobiales bacterium]